MSIKLTFFPPILKEAKMSFSTVGAIIFVIALVFFITRLVWSEFRNMNHEEQIEFIKPNVGKE